MSTDGREDRNVQPLRLLDIHLSELRGDQDTVLVHHSTDLQSEGVSFGPGVFVDGRSVSLQTYEISRADLRKILLTFD